MVKIVGSIVTFNPAFEVLEKTIQTFLQSTTKSATESLVVIWDNSPADTISQKLKKFDDRVHYHKSPANFGYGKGNNEVFKKYAGDTAYFCVLNPDLELTPDSMPRLISFMEQHPQWGLASGDITNPAGETDPVHKLLPSFIHYSVTFAARKFLGKVLDKNFHNVFLKLKENPSRLPITSGCFMLFRSSHFQELKGFDERFFLYFEDWDLSLRSYLTGQSILLPDVRITHAWARQSHKKFAIFLIHLKSAFTFYSKWGFGNKISKLANAHAGYFDPNKKAAKLVKEL